MRTAHLTPSKNPAGGNICFIDNHIEWRPFARMTNTVVIPGEPSYQF